MPRLMRPLRWVLNSPRMLRQLPKHQQASLQLPDGQTVVIQSVRLKQRRQTVGGRINRYLLAGVSIYIIGSFIIEQEFLDDVFIPFPLTTRRLDPQPYRGTDPEWQEFVRIAKDKDLQTKLKQNLANSVLQAARKNPVLTMRTGKEIQIRRYWMDVDYPYVAPPEYEASGLKFTDEYIEWTKQPVDSFTAKLLDRVLWPTPMASSFWALGTAIVGHKTAEIARYFGISTASPEAPPSSTNASSPGPLPSSHNPQIQKALDRMRRNSTRNPGEVRDPSSMTLDAPEPPRGKTPAPASDKTPTSTENAQPAGDRFWGEDKVKSAVSTGFSPWKVFMKQFGKTWTPIHPEPPRGSVAFSGLVELDSTKCWVVVDVFGWYDPKAKQFTNVMMRLRRLQDKMQSPMR
ncbi:hypothetical protein B0T16DRAFT_363347 [Cercophora newfieldiana]|uniref:Uncharacterized protein n=1 Tax=Cercophora newfieldiana TaxID=92897 RepID=A0AA40D094_9PEZI|nr:hypothetical protein B0T16DRAFT_363347 [Cercophora newfieldiana]